MKEELKEFIRNSRRQFRSTPFHEGNVLSNPIEQFNVWFENAVATEVKDPFAFTLATANTNGIPSARVVYMRQITQNGIAFFTNYNSHKGKNLLENPVACANFYWEDLSRQVRFTGSVEKLPDEESDSYFLSRPRESKLGAYASHQSEVISGRDALMNRLDELKKEYEGRDVLRPDFWGGFLIKPYEVEFWQGRDSRLHDRIRYELSENGEWKIERLSP